MTRLYQTVAAIFLLFGASVIYLSIDLSYSADFGPGPGFFPFWLGVLLVLLAIADLVGLSRRPREPLAEGFIPDRKGMGRLVSISGGLLIALFLMKPLGFTFTILLFTIFLLRAMGRQSWWTTLLISFIGSFGTFYIFGLLQVSLPTGPWGF